MLATLGTIEFDGLNSFSDLKQKEESSYPEHALFLNKPRLQRTGDLLDEATFSMLFNNSFCVPEDRIEELRQARRNGNVLPMLLGTGEFIGDFVITSIETVHEQLGKLGNIISARVSVTIREFYDPNKQATKQAAFKKAAFAFDELKPLPLNLTQQPLAPSAEVMDEISTADLAVQQSVNAVFLADQGLSAFESASAAIEQATAKVAQAVSNAQAVLSTVVALQVSASTLNNKLTSLKNNAESLASSMPITSAGQATDASNDLLSAMQDVKSASAPLAVITAIRGIVL